MAGEVEKRTGVEESGPGFTDFVAWLWLRRKVYLGTIVAVASAVTLLTMVQPPHYTAAVTILPGSEPQNSGLLGQVASYTGLSFDQDGSFAMLYEKIVRSDRFLEGAIERSWASEGAGGEETLFELMGIGDGDAAADSRQRERLIRRLRQDVVSFFRDERTGFMVLSVEVPRSPRLAAELANYLAGRLDEFDRALRKQRAADQLDFLRNRLSDVEQELDASTDLLTTFLEGNRSYISSPALQSRHGELKREVAAQTSVWVELRRQVELAEIEQHQDEGPFTILDAARPPLRKSSPVLTASLLIGGFTGIVTGFLVLAAGHLLGAVRGQLRIAAAAGPK